VCRGIRKPHHKVKLVRGVKEDLRVWEQFLLQFNGRCFFLDDNFVTADTLQLYTDASGSLGYGAVFQKSWFSGVWDVSWSDVNITVKELYPIVVAFEIWGDKLENKSVCFNCDNEALVYVLNKHTSKDPKIMYLVRRLVLFALKYNILFTAKHLPGRVNILSDALSRLQVSKFRALMPEADQQPAPIPPLPILPD